MDGFALFMCTPYGCRLTPIACAKRHRLAQEERADLGSCRTCGVGAEHARQHPDAKPSGKRKNPAVHAAIERAQAKRRAAEKDAPTRTSASPAPPEREPDCTGASADAAAEAGAETPGTRWCSSADEAPPSPRRVGAPPPAAPMFAEEWRRALAADAVELARAVDMLAARAPAVGNAPLQARAALLRRLGEWSIPAIVEDLRERGAPEDLDAALAAKWVERGTSIVDEAVRQVRLFDEAPEVHALADLVGAIVRARRSDAGRPRPKARGARPRKVEPTTDDTHVPLLGADDTEAA